MKKYGHKSHGYLAICLYMAKKNAGWFDTCWLVPAALTVLEEYYCIHCSCIFFLYCRSSDTYEKPEPNSQDYFFVRLQ